MGIQFIPKQFHLNHLKKTDFIKQALKQHMTQYIIIFSAYKANVLANSYFQTRSNISIPLKSRFCQPGE